MIHHGDAAAGAFDHLPAAGAHAHGLIAPPVEQQDRLLAPGQGLADAPGQRGADAAGVSGGQFGAHIHHFHRGQRLARITPGELIQGIAALQRGLVAFHTGGGRSEQHQSAVVHGPALGHLPGIEAGCAFRPVGVLLLFVQHDEADVFQRREYRTAGAHHDVGPAGLDHLPLQQALGVTESRMLHRYPPAEGLLQAADHLGSQADLRHQHQSSLAQLQRALDQL